MTTIVASAVKINSTIASLTESVIDLVNVKTLSVYAKYTVAAATAKTFTTVDQAQETATVTAHGYATGRKGQLTTSGTLPTGLSLATDYFIIAVDANTVKFATSLANALAGTPVNLTGAGTGTHTFTPTALAGGIVNIYETNDSDSSAADWNVIPNMTANITATGKSVFKPNADSRYAKISFDMTAGQMDVIATVCAKDG
jgi:hypothetical protein